MWAAHRSSSVRLFIVAVLAVSFAVAVSCCCHSFRPPSPPVGRTGGKHPAPSDDVTSGISMPAATPTVGSTPPNTPPASPTPQSPPLPLTGNWRPQTTGATNWLWPVQWVDQQFARAAGSAGKVHRHAKPRG